MNIIAIIQARMCSTRLPAKVLLDIAGKPMLERVVERVNASALIGKVIVATTEDPADEAIAALCCRISVETFRGSMDDVLDRYYWAARAVRADIVLRITGDCPLLDPRLIDRSISTFLHGTYDYVSLARPVSTFPDGLDSEVLSFAVLERTWREATLPSEREHVTPYIWKNPGLFKLGTLSNERDLSAMRWTVDEERDLRFVREVYRHAAIAKRQPFGMADTLAVLERHPKLLKINEGIERDSGYKASLLRDVEIPRS
jgi:spore coat polysaccharide biosynthesis protein SpsF (cytidylyltransferase family)